MKTGTGKYAAPIVALLAGFFLLVSAGLVQAAGDVVIICNKSVKADSVSQEDVKDIFLGKKTTWDDGRKINFVTLKEGPAHESFVEKYVGKTAPQYDSYWKKQVFTGRARTPKVLATAEDIIGYVTITNGAIGYIPAGALDEGLRVIRFTGNNELSRTQILASMALQD